MEKLPIKFLTFGFVTVPSADDDGHASVKQWLVNDSGRKGRTELEAGIEVSPDCYLDKLAADIEVSPSCHLDNFLLAGSAARLSPPSLAD